MNKLFAVRADYRRDFGRTNEIVSNEKSPKLWIITPTASDDLLDHYGAKPHSKWVSGIYFSIKGNHTRFVVVDKLPKTKDTMWLRLFGRGEDQEGAINEVLTLEQQDNQRNEALRLLSTWKISIDLVPQPTDEDLEFKMIVSKAYQEWEQATRRQGIEQGIEQSQRIWVENLLKARFGTLDPELTNIISSLSTQPTEECARLLLQLSREELINRFS